MTIMDVKVFLNTVWNEETHNYDDVVVEFTGVTGISASEGILGIEMRTLEETRATVYNLNEVVKWEIVSPNDESADSDDGPVLVEG